MWIYEGQEFTDAEISVGFVYMITNLVTGRRYIGKKLFTKAATKQVKGKKKKIRKPSDWQQYYGSNKELVEDVKTHGAENFTREILRLCATRGECTYWEAKYQFQFGVLEAGPKEWYNGQIMCRVHRTHLRHKPQS